MSKLNDPSGFDPERPLPGPPEPWHWAEQPIDRGAPPWFMTEMIEAEPAFAERLLTRLIEAGPDGAAARLAVALRETAAAGAPVTVVGCGTSEHGALGAAEILRDAWQRAGLPGHGPTAAQAFEASLEPRGGLCIGISHDGATWATTQALEAARAVGARTSIVTVSGRASGAQGVDIVVETLERDQSYCHTIGYTSPLVAAYAVGRLIGRDFSWGPEDAIAIRNLMAAGLGLEATAAAETMAAALAGCRPILTVASGADRTAARELVLKLEEGTWIPAASRNLETFLHGHLPSTDPGTGLILILTDRRARAERVARARQALEAAALIGIRVGAILSTYIATALDPSLTPIGRIVVPEAATLPAPVASLLGTATALQLLVERLARVVGTNPDTIRRHDPVYAAAAARAEG
jgi:glucosamine--fructose-6-phosphate aminotransferase (isomerizing)